jgi:hypothetical protein
MLACQQLAQTVCRTLQAVALVNMYARRAPLAD